MLKSHEVKIPEILEGNEVKSQEAEKLPETPEHNGNNESQETEKLSTTSEEEEKVSAAETLEKVKSSYEEQIKKLQKKLFDKNSYIADLERISTQIVPKEIELRKREEMLKYYERRWKGAAVMEEKIMLAFQKHERMMEEKDDYITGLPARDA